MSKSSDTPYEKQEWWTSPLEDDNGQLIMVTGRNDIQKFRDNPRFSIRIDITMPYNHDASGMPDKEDAILLEQIVDAFQEQLIPDPIAVLTGIYTGAGSRNMIFYTTSTNIFNKKLNAALQKFPLLPLQIVAENDPQWNEYSEMKELSLIR